MLNNYDDLMTVQEVCGVLMVGKNRIYELLQSGRLDGFRTGRIWKIPKLSLEKFIRSEAGLRMD